MRLTHLTLENYRNYSQLDISFDPAEPLTCIVGENAQGKTNILEAIYLLALTKSFRTFDQKDVIQWGKEYARVRGTFEEENKAVEKANTKPSQMNLEIFLGHLPHPEKVLKKNGVQVNAESFVGTCQIVFFHPESLSMLYLGPELRRHYIDVLNLQVNKKIWHILQNYRRILKQRNTLLKSQKEHSIPTENLRVWDEQLVEYGSIIIMERSKTVDYLNQNLQQHYQKIADSDAAANIQYISSIGTSGQKRDITQFQQDFAEGNNFANFESCKKAYREAMQQAYSRDMRMQYTTVGPHRDNVIFSLNNRQLACHASRGEYRSLLLALKFLELQFFEEKVGKKPLLLLDDVFSELDVNRQKMLLKAITEHQTIMTTTHADHLPDYASVREHAGLGQAKERYFEIKNGHIMS